MRMSTVGAGGDCLAVVRAVVLHRLDDRRVGRLRREAREVEVLVGLEPMWRSAPIPLTNDESRADFESLPKSRRRAVSCRTSSCSSSRGATFGWKVCGCWSSVEQITCGGAIGNDWSEHCWTSAVVTNGMSGRPVTAPVESLQLRMSSTDDSAHRRGADHGDVVLARLDLGVGRGIGVELRVVEVDHELAARQAAAAGLAVQELGEAFDRVLRALEQVGEIGLSTSAMTATWISLAVIPTSVALGCSATARLCTGGDGGGRERCRSRPPGRRRAAVHEFASCSPLERCRRPVNLTGRQISSGSIERPAPRYKAPLVRRERSIRRWARWRSWCRNSVW